MTPPAAARRRRDTEQPDEREPGTRELQRRERLSAILNAAITVFSTVGPAEFSSRRVAAEAGVNLSLVQHYFRTREALVLATVDAIIGSYPARYAQLAEDTALPARKRLELVMDDALDAASQPSIVHFMVQAMALGVHDDAVGRLIQERYQNFVDAVASLIRQAEPTCSAREAAIRAAHFVSQVDGLMLLHYRGGRVAPREQQRRRLRRYLDYLLLPDAAS